MSNTNPMLKYIDDATIQIVQTFMNEHVLPGKPMTAASIYETMVKMELLPSTTVANTFKTSLSANIKAGNIKGFEGRRRVGYCVAGDLGEDNVEEEVTDDEGTSEDTPSKDEGDKFIVKLTQKLRICRMDKLNFNLQRRNGNDWTTCGYYSSLQEVFKGAVKYMIDNGLKEHSGCHDAKEVVKILNQIECNIIGQLFEAVKQVKESTAA